MKQRQRPSGFSSLQDLVALMPVVRVVALNEVLQIPEGHGMLLEGEVRIGP